ncbi:hypothetical protein WA026_002961 [Henosepilachna vigintioctopunctata]|uniref:Uncharacterized protein n=1 Tax=Henosepilachna vigintioctopunctata TaxID=420089 RepID=A0AAW1THS4_9CUCU
MSFLQEGGLPVWSENWLIPSESVGFSSSKRPHKLRQTLQECVMRTPRAFDNFTSNRNFCYGMQKFISNIDCAICIRSWLLKISTIAIKVGMEFPSPSEIELKLTVKMSEVRSISTLNNSS